MLEIRFYNKLLNIREGIDKYEREILSENIEYVFDNGCFSEEFLYVMKKENKLEEWGLTRKEVYGEQKTIYPYQVFVVEIKDNKNKITGYIVMKVYTYEIWWC